MPLSVHRKRYQLSALLAVMATPALAQSPYNGTVFIGDRGPGPELRQGPCHCGPGGTLEPLGSAEQRWHQRHHSAEERATPHCLPASAAASDGEHRAGGPAWRF